MKLKDICEVLNGYAFKSTEYKTSGIRVLRITNVKNGFIDDLTPVYYEKKEELKNYELKENDILISLTGNVGRVALIDSEILPAYLNQRVCCLRIKNDKIISSKFLFYLLNTKKFERECINASRGIAQLNLGTEWIKNYEIDIPSLDEQEKIISKFDYIYTAKSKIQKQLIKINKLREVYFNETFGNIVSGFNYDMVSFEFFLNSIIKGPFGSDMKKSLYVPKGIDTYKVYIQANVINQDEQIGDYYISKDYFIEKVHRYEVLPGDYLITCDGTLGKHIKLDNNIEKGVISSSLMRIRLNDKMCDHYFEDVWDYYMMKIMQKNIRNAALNHLPSASVVSKILIPNPPLYIQKEYNDKIDNLLELQKKYIKEFDELQLLNESLIYGCFN